MIVEENQNTEETLNKEEQIEDAVNEEKINHDQDNDLELDPKVQDTNDTLILEEPDTKSNMINYLDASILDVKEYSADQVNEISIDDIDEKDFDENVYNINLSDVSERTVVKGKIVAIDDKDVIIDIGFKSEGAINKNEFSKIPNVGDEVDVYVRTFEDRKGRLILSKEKADFERRWQELRDAFTNDTMLTGRIIKRIKGGMVVDLGVVNAFLPGSQLDVKTVTDFDQFVNMECDFKIVKFNEFRQNIVVSRKAVMSDGLDDKKKEFLENLEVGMDIDGIVKNITDFGAFIDLGGGIDGLLHITDITWGRINHPSDKLTLGEQLKVKVIDYDKVKNRVSLGLKQLEDDPWKNVVDNYSVDKKITGKVVNIMNYGVFLEIEEGVEGLIHISEMSWFKHIKHPSDLYKLGDSVDAKILSIDSETKKISLGVKQLEKDPWQDMEEKFKKNSKYTGKISQINQSGAFIELENGVYGFLHINDISWTRKIKYVTDVLTKGEQLELLVIDVNKDDKKINLGLKQLNEDPWLDIGKSLKVGDEMQGELLYKLEKGYIFLLDNDFEGIVPIKNVSSNVNAEIGQKFTLKIIDINVENRKVVLDLSIKDSESVENPTD